MKTRLTIALFAILGLFAFTGCKTVKIDKAVSYVAQLAPEGEDNAVDGYRTLTIKNVGKWNIHFVGLYKEDGVLHADSFQAEGMWTRYEGAPFAHPIKEETE